MEALEIDSLHSTFTTLPPSIAEGCVKPQFYLLLSAMNGEGLFFLPLMYFKEEGEDYVFLFVRGKS